VKEKAMDAATITKLQISRIWATAHELGLDRESLYRQVPGGSISHLSRGQASDVIERLESLKRHEQSMDMPPASSVAQETVTPEQIHFIHYLFGRLGWLRDPGHMANFLHKYFHVNRLEELPDRKRASAVIEALKAIVARRGGRTPRPNPLDGQGHEAPDPPHDQQDNACALSVDDSDPAHS
jgi:hypothetical protein